MKQQPGWAGVAHLNRLHLDALLRKYGNPVTHKRRKSSHFRLPKCEPFVPQAPTTGQRFTVKHMKGN